MEQETAGACHENWHVNALGFLGHGIPPGGLFRLMGLQYGCMTRARLRVPSLQRTSPRGCPVPSRQSTLHSLHCSRLFRAELQAVVARGTYGTFHDRVCRILHALLRPLSDFYRGDLRPFMQHLPWLHKHRHQKVSTPPNRVRYRSSEPMTVPCEGIVPSAVNGTA